MTGLGPDHASQLCLPLEVTRSFKKIPMPRSTADVLTSLVGGDVDIGDLGRRTSAAVCLARHGAFRAAFCGGRVQTSLPRLPLRHPPAVAPILASRWLTPGSGPARGCRNPVAAVFLGAGPTLRKAVGRVLADTIGAQFAAYASSGPPSSSKERRVSITAASLSQCPCLQLTCDLAGGGDEVRERPCLQGRQPNTCRPCLYPPARRRACVPRQGTPYLSKTQGSELVRH